MYRAVLCSNKPTIAILQKTHTPDKNPNSSPNLKSRPGVFCRYMPRLTAITTESKSDHPNIFPLLPAFIFSSARLFSRIHAFPKRAGEYHIPPNTKAEIPATSIANQFNVFIIFSFNCYLSPMYWLFFYYTDSKRMNPEKNTTNTTEK